VQLHLADNGHDRGQYALTVFEGVGATLGSYHYLKSPHAIRGLERLWDVQCRLAAGETDEAFVEAWRALMHLHLSSTHGGPLHGDSLAAEDVESTLMSYAYRGTEVQFLKPWRNGNVRPRVIIDSGAFTAHASGKPIRREDYLAWAIDFAERWRERFHQLTFINLDVIGDQAATLENQAWFEGQGFPVLPVLTQGAPMGDLDLLLDRYDYVCFGGLVPLANQPSRMKWWLDRCFKRVVGRYRETGVMPRVHLLGVSQRWVLNRYPAYSSDSTSWVKPLRFGGGEQAGLGRKLPKYKESPAAWAATIHALRAEIRRHKQMEKDATDLWTERGVVFGD
jgi:hypothetical protein